MLIKNAVLAKIADGSVDLAFRRWNRASVRQGTQLKTAIGLVEIESIETVLETAITEAEALRAGYASRTALMAELNQGRSGQVYRIALRAAGADPRLALREITELTPVELSDIVKKLERLDRSSPKGAWTVKVLHAIQDDRMLPAISLAQKLGYEKAWLKLNIRKLKNLGLTISHNPGYEISPRGAAVLQHLSGDE